MFSGILADTLADLPRRLLETDNFVTRDNCGDWIPEIATISIICDFAIGFSYMLLATVILFSGKIFGHTLLPSRATNSFFTLFIFICGITHFFQALSFNIALYDHLAVTLVLLTAASVTTLPVAIWWCVTQAKDKTKASEVSEGVRRATDSVQDVLTNHPAMAANPEMADLSKDILRMTDELSRLLGPPNLMDPRSPDDQDDAEK